MFALQHDVRLLKAEEVAQILAVRKKRVYELGIPSIRISEKSIRWRMKDVEHWLLEHTRGGQNEAL